MIRGGNSILDAVMIQIADALASSQRRPVVIGLCGAQGSGKSTLARAALEACGARGIRGAVLSIDDLYLARAQRQELAHDIHPLLATRGVPGTHDVELGLSVLSSLDRGEAAALPRFDKVSDDRAPAQDWPLSPAPCDVLLFEGWCIGALPQDAAALAEPVNALEREEDPQGIWRSWSNAALADRYQTLFARLDRLVLLVAPRFEIVRRWRLEQEQQLARTAITGSKLMDAPQIDRFVSHYERITRHILAEMPARADLVIELDAERVPLAIRSRG